MVRDIRDLTSDPVAYAAELQRRWGGLLSYRYIGRHHASMTVGPEDDTVNVRHDMRDVTGGILLSVFGIASPEGGLVSDLEAVPNPVVHSCQVLDAGIGVKRFEVRSEDLKRGQRMSYSRSMIVDADHPDRVLALTEGQGVTIGVPPDGLQKMSVEPLEVADSADLPRLWQVFGGCQVDTRTWTLPELTAEVASPDAALHVGPQFVMTETAARSAVVESSRTTAVVGVSSHTMFLARAKSGPFRFVAQAIPGAGPLTAARTQVYDDGADGKLVTVATHVFRSV
jgi:acyl-coenzyme A thioesterase PaaI-like protein